MQGLVESSKVRADFPERKAFTGWRIDMEDAHTHLLTLGNDPGTVFFAVYDGHGGPRVSRYAAAHLHNTIVNHPLYGSGSPIKHY